MNNLTILIPMAGKSVFFRADDFHFPKPLIEIDGKPMIQHVIENLKTFHGHIRFIFVLNREECRKHHLDQVVRLLTDGRCEIITINGETQGYACSALLAIEHIDNEEELIIANSDQIFDLDLNEMLSSFRQENLDAGVPVFDTVHPRWSYVELGPKEDIIEAAEKKPLSRNAVAGLFYFRRGRFFVRAAMNMIKKDARVNDAFYIAPALNEMILDNRKLGIFQLDADRYHSFYSPEKIKVFERRKGC